MPRFVYGLCALSGMSALIYELVWARALGLHFGTSTPAVTTVVAVFMAGLALGNAVLGRSDEAAQAFESAARASADPEFRRLVTMLATDA